MSSTVVDSATEMQKSMTRKVLLIGVPFILAIAFTMYAQVRTQNRLWTIPEILLILWFAMGRFDEMRFHVIYGLVVILSSLLGLVLWSGLGQHWLVRNTDGTAVTSAEKSLLFGVPFLDDISSVESKNKFACPVDGLTGEGVQVSSRLYAEVIVPQDREVILRYADHGMAGELTADTCSAARAAFLRSTGGVCMAELRSAVTEHDSCAHLARNLDELGLHLRECSLGAIKAVVRD